jgi:hypothetical protein
MNHVGPSLRCVARAGNCLILNGICDVERSSATPSAGKANVTRDGITGRMPDQISLSDRDCASGKLLVGMQMSANRLSVAVSDLHYLLPGSVPLRI